MPSSQRDHAAKKVCGVSWVSQCGQQIGELKRFGVMSNCDIAKRSSAYAKAAGRCEPIGLSGLHKRSLQSTGTSQMAKVYNMGNRARAVGCRERYLVLSLCFDEAAELIVNERKIALTHVGAQYLGTPSIALGLLQLVARLAKEYHQTRAHSRASCPCFCVRRVESEGLIQ
jgi:hypothetical protein